MTETSIKTGILQTSQQPFDMRVLHLHHLKEIQKVQETVRKQLKSSSTLEVLSEQEFENILSGNGMMVGTFVKGKLIGFRALLIPSFDDPEHLGIDAGLEREQLQEVVYSEVTAVHPGYRGNRLQTLMGQALLQQIDAEKYPYLVATVAPFNIPSIKDKLTLGMKIIGLKEKYHGKLRYIFFSDVKEEAKSFSKQQTVAMGKTSVQQQLLSKNYVGTSLALKNNGYHVKYEK